MEGNLGDGWRIVGWSDGSDSRIVQTFGQETEDRRPRMESSRGDGWRIVGRSDRRKETEDGRRETEDRRPRMEGNLGDGWRIVGWSDGSDGRMVGQEKGDGRPETGDGRPKTGDRGWKVAVGMAGG
jgi:hypothetical protein